MKAFTKILEIDDQIIHYFIIVDNLILHTRKIYIFTNIIFQIIRIRQLLDYFKYLEYFQLQFALK